MCCSSKSVEVIDSSSRYPTQHGNYDKNLANIIKSKNDDTDDNIPQTSKEIKTLMSKGERATQKGDYSEAIKTYKEMISYYPNDDSAYFNLG